jgi:hypothetical protein
MTSRGLAALLCALATLTAAGSSAGATERRAASDFHRLARVEGSAVAGQAYAIPLSRAAVAALKKGGELRLFDAAGREIPSLVVTAESRGEVIERPVSVFNRAWQPDGTQTLDVELTDRKPQAVNEFVFEIADEDYNVRARVEGSPDGEAWRILGDGLHLIRHTVKEEKIRYVHDVLRIPTARFRSYRFTLQPTTAPDQDFEPLEIEGVKVRQVVKRGASLAVPVHLERFEDPRDPDDRHHYWKLDLGREDLGVDRVELTIPADDFARSASLWEWSTERGRRTRQLASTVLFRYAYDAHTGFSGVVTDAQVLAARIDQGDDEAVRVVAARASRPRQQLRFLAPPTATMPLALHFDPDDAREPRYDLARRLREHEIDHFAELAHGPLEENPAYAAPPPPHSERIPYLLYALVIPLVAGLGWYVARTIQRGVPEDPPPSGS